MFYEEHTKPKQLSGLYPSAATIPADATLLSYGIKGCRSSALERCAAPQGLPVFSWVDELEPLEQHAPGYDFYLLPCGRLCWCEAVVTFLSLKLISPSDIKAAVRASGHYDVARYKAARDTYRSCVAHLWEHHPDQCRKTDGSPLEMTAAGMSKGGILAMIGLFKKNQNVTGKSIYQTAQGTTPAPYTGSGAYFSQACPSGSFSAAPSTEAFVAASGPGAPSLSGWRERG